MSRGPYSFKSCDITRTLKAARKAGETVQIEVDIDRRCMRIIPIKLDETTADTSGSELDQWVAKHARTVEGH
jgi:hypothetical protein